MPIIKEINTNSLAKKIEKDLKNSGITNLNRNKIKIRPMSRDDFKQVDKKLTHYGYEIPYFDLHNNPLEHSRYKILSNPPVTDKRLKKYHQLKGTPNRVYFPPFFDWHKIAEDSTQYINITEGEKKAICGCVNDAPTLGLPGVWTFMNKSKTDLCDDLLQFNWVGREVYIVFDNDSETNPFVKKAKLTLATLLVKNGAEVFDVMIPKGDLKGMDDYIVAKGIDEFDELENKQMYGDAVYLFNQRCAFIHSMGVIREIETGHMWTPDKAKYVFANVRTEVLTEDGPKNTLVLGEWLKHWDRRTYDKLVFKPGQPEDLKEGLNIYKDDRIIAKKGPIKKYLNMLEYLFIEDETIDYVVKWVAHKRRFPHIRIRTNLIFYSISQQVGKSAIIEKIFFKLIGDDSCITIGSDDLHDKNNAWMERKLLVFAEEIRSYGKGTRSEEIADKLKPIISVDRPLIKEKYVPSYRIDSYVNLIITSNSATPFFMERGDMRYYVVHVNETRQKTEEYQKFYDWVKGDGIHYIAEYMDNVDLSGFNPNDTAPMTDAKLYSIELDTPDYERWLQEFVEGDKLVAHADNDDCSSKIGWTMEEIKKKYDYDNSDNDRYSASRKALGGALSRLGIQQARPWFEHGGIVKQRIVYIMSFDSELAASTKKQFKSKSRTWVTNYFRKYVITKRIQL